MNIILIGVFIGTMTVTSYRSIPNQTDNSPWHTSTGERVTIRGCAVSRDLLKANGGPLEYGDLIYVEGFGYRFVNDTMNKRMKQHIDLWVPTYSEERKVGITSGKIYLVKREEVCQKRTNKFGSIVASVMAILGIFK